MNNTTIRNKRPSGVRNDTRSLLRSRPMQGMLVGVAMLQGVAVVGGKAAVALAGGAAAYMVHQNEKPPAAGRWYVSDAVTGK